MPNHWKLPFQFDIERLQADLVQIAPEEWIAHFNTNQYEGDWSGVALRAVQDSAMPLYPDPHATSSYINTEFLARCPYIAEVLQTFQFELESVRLLRLRAGSHILEHRDYRLGLEEGALRLHIPIITNPDVQFYLAGELVPMQPGETWYMNLSLPHKVINHSTTDRVHLVIDGIANDWIYNLIPMEDTMPQPVVNATQPTSRAAEPAPATIQQQAYDPALVQQIQRFLNEIGLPMRQEPLIGKTFVPGVAIHHGAIVVDPAQLLFPGDILHEAGHLAIVPAARRAAMHINAGSDPAEEMMAIGWSYAAVVYLGIDPAIVFYSDGYRGGGNSLVENFAAGYYIGVPMLQWVGLTLDEKNAKAQNLPPYPHMLAWLRA